jgi:RHS repeat-associated protein
MHTPYGQVWKSYYFQGATRLALRVQVNGVGDKVYYLLTDHLGSTTVSYRADGGETRTQSYKPWGEVREEGNSLPTDRTFTGQRWDSYINLHWYGSRWYDDQLGRWIQPDSIVPEAAQGVQAWDRFAYANNNAVRYNDPSGHDVGCAGMDCSDYTTQLRVYNKYVSLWADVQQVKIDDLVALERLSDYTASLHPDCVSCYIDEMGSVLTGISNSQPIKSIQDNREGKFEFDGPYSKTQKFGQRLSQDGYDPIFKDPEGGGDQSRHFWFYVQSGYYDGQVIAAGADYYHEYIDRQETGGHSFNDFALGIEGALTGASLRSGSIKPDQVGGMIKKSLEPGSWDSKFWKRDWK